MATETGPDLTFARQQVELLMDDTCRVVRPTEFTPSAVDSAEVVIAETPCIISERSAAPEASVDEEEYRYGHRASLPVDAVTDTVVEGDVVIALSSRRDATLPGATFIVRGVKRSTFLVTRRLQLERFVFAGTASDDYPEEMVP